MKTIAAIFAATVAFNPAFAAPTERPPVPAAKPVTETLFGQSITDQFRYFEQQDATLTDWMKAEGRYARSVLDALPQHDATLAKLSAMTGSWDVVGTITTAAGGRTFYEQRSSGSDNFDLMVREADGKTRKLVDVSAIRAANGGEPFAINYFTPSNDGNKIAVGISEGGSEDASLWIYDVATGSRIAGPVPNAQFGIIGWTPDDRHLFTTLMQGVKPGRPETDKYLNSKAYVWDLKGAPVPILGVGISPAVPFKPEEFPGVFTVPDAPLALAVNVNGVQNEMAIWTAPVTAAGSADAPWKPFVKRDDDVTNIAVAGNRIFLLSHKDAPTFKVLALNAGEPIGAAKEVIAARPDRVIEGIAAASDGLYVRARRGVYSELLKIPLEGGPEQAIELPFKGSINELSADPRYPGVKLILDSWAVPQRNLA
jgi:prolyl oligopeptidase